MTVSLFLLHCREITETMRTVQSPADILPNPRRYLSNYFLVTSTARLFVPSNSIIFITTQEVGGVSNTTGLYTVPRPPLDDKEPIYGTKYSSIPISEDLLSFWTANNSTVTGDLYLPSRNKFIPSDLSLIPVPDNLTEGRYMQQFEGALNWIFLDTVNFPQPRVNYKCNFTSGNSDPSALWQGKYGVYNEGEVSQ